MEQAQCDCEMRPADARGAEDGDVFGAITFGL
jgi:hypothetical protein